MKPTCLLMLAALAAGSAVMAQPPAGGPNGRRPLPKQPMPPPQSPPPPLFLLLDADRNGVLSAAEVRAASAVLAKADRNRDGEVTVQELRPQRTAEDHGKPPHPPMRPVPPLIAALDTDRDGTISAAEMSGAGESLKELDRNHDGQLTPEELRPMGPPPKGPQGPAQEPEGPSAGPDGALEGVE